jgi:hypothetical protein
VRRVDMELEVLARALLVYRRERSQLHHHEVHRCSLHGQSTFDQNA